MIGGLSDRMARHQRRLDLPPVRRRFDPPTELVAAATAACVAGVPIETRERLGAAAAALPTQGLPIAWHDLAASARAYVAAHGERTLAPAADLGAAIARACAAGVPDSFSAHHRSN